MEKLKSASQVVGHHLPSLRHNSSMDEEPILSGWLYLESSTMVLTGARGFARLYASRLDMTASDQEAPLLQHLVLSNHSQLTQLTRRHFTVREHAGQAVWATVTRRTLNKVQLVCVPVEHVVC